MHFLKKKFYFCFNLETDPDRGGRELSIAHKIRVETCREGSHTPLQASGKGRSHGSAIPGVLV